MREGLRIWAREVVQMDMFRGISNFQTEWCEPSYELTPMITELFNTGSNMPGIILALIGFINSIHQKFERRFGILHFFSVLVGIGSMVLHCTLQIKEQQSDEIPMVWIMLLYLYVLYSPEIHLRRVFPLCLIIYGIGFAFMQSKYQLIVGFQLHYLFLALLCSPGMYKHYMNTTDTLAQRLAHQYLFCLSFALTLWCLDQRFCERKSTLPLTPQWHAVFHVLNGLNNYFGVMYLQYCRAHQLHLNPQLRYIGGVLPYVKVLMKNSTTPVIQAEEALKDKAQ